ncbi:Putative peptidase M16, metalloenzyme, LuxS/M16 peptidase, peptidase M16, middle/third [Septoria linicola]|uniref:Peptidase M16, metalloenzyme, LuxS/M16 peptidase, peptidase M16, middle/third n=1 Tax=Septoria linicola TaxID=215465 RepID=A0A9Q9ASV7_9PEZI|nr:Putative peptidase M16, metalloenzyme, LuxS/M16 peptidase, peptidase M16, middle/third [Septoria linicola]
MDTETVLRSRPEGTRRLADKLEKPLLDDRSYRVIELPNKLEVLLIHDPDTDKASAAMDVNVGSFSDPEEMQGMAHAVEHLLFLGTEKYPGENDYNSYLVKYGGYSNAFTAGTDTNYYFELSASSTSNSAKSSANTSKTSLLSVSKSQAPLYGALDRFAQFFVKPLFREDCLDRELRAVDSENKKNLQADNWRLMQLAKSTAGKEHPYHLFSTGNYQILHDDPIARGVKIRDEFIKFYEKNYSANRMKLCVLGRESLDELQQWTEELFSDIPNQDLPQLRWDGVPVLTEAELCTQIFAKPVMDQRYLDLSFPYPDEENEFESMPGRYLGHMIGHEGPGSILAYLKAKGWVTELSAGPSPVCPGTAFFNIGVRLTTKGLENHREVIKTIFQYIAMLKEEPPLEWVTKETAQLAEIDFKFKQKIPASRTTSHMSGVMQKPLPREWLLSGQYLVRKHDPEAITRGLNALRPDNFRYTMSARDFTGDMAVFDRKEQWYGTEHRVEKIPSDFLQELEATSKGSRPAELHMPAKNEFIPQRLDVEKKDVASAALTPTLIRNDPNLRLWWKKDDTFWVPKANVYVYLRSPIGYLSAYTAVLSSLFKELVDDSLTEYAYDAELAGLQYDLLRTANAYEVTVSGYNDKMHVLLEKVLVTMRDLEVKEDRFDIIKERMTRNYQNLELQEPFRQVGRYTGQLSREKAWGQAELLAELPNITVEDVRTFVPSLMRQMHIEILAHGNLYKEDALRMADLVEKTLKPRALPPSQWENTRYIALPEGLNFAWQKTLKNPDNVNHCLDYCIYVGNSSDRHTRAKLLLLDQILREPVFDTLRTQEQLGYIVSGGMMIIGNMAAFRILIQSEKDCGYLLERSDRFLTEFETTLVNMSDTDFEEHRVGIINKRLEKLKNLNQESGRLWHHVLSEVFDFELVYRDVEVLETLSKDDVLEFYKTKFSPSSDVRSTFAVQLVAQSSAEDIAAKTTDMEKCEKLADGLIALFAQMGLQAEAEDRTKLVKEFKKADVSKGESQPTLNAVGTWLAAVGLDEESTKAVLAQSEQALPQLFPAAGIVSAQAPAETNGHAASTGTSNGVKKVERILVEDVKAWKASMPLAANPKPVKDVTEFEELEPKL